MRALRAEAPRARVQLRSLRSAEQFDALARGELDRGYTYAPPPAGSGLTSRCVVDEAFVLAVPRHHPLAAGDAPLTGLTDEPFIAPLSLAGRDEMLAACTAMGWTIDVCCEAADPAAALGLVHAGVGLALVQTSLARTVPVGVVVRELPEAFAMRIHLVGGVAASPLAQRVLGAGRAGDNERPQRSL